MFETCRGVPTLYTSKNTSTLQTEAFIIVIIIFCWVEIDSFSIQKLSSFSKTFKIMYASWGFK